MKSVGGVPAGSNSLPVVTRRTWGLHKTSTASPVEDVQVRGDQILVRRPIAEGKHVGIPGEDVVSGQSVLAAGRQIRPQDVGLLSSLTRQTQ